MRQELPVRNALEQIARSCIADIGVLAAAAAGNAAQNTLKAPVSKGVRVTPENRQAQLGLLFLSVCFAALMLGLQIA